MKKLLLPLFLILVGITQAYAQGYAVTGSILSSSDKTALPGANVVLIKNADASKTATVTDGEGRFRFERIANGQYTVEVNYIGFQKFSKPVLIQGAALNLGPLQLSDGSTAIKEVQIVGRAQLGEQKGDTAQFNAKAFKTAPDASAEDLVTKMPGITVQDGKLQAQGEDVKQVMIDGKRYTGEDVNSAVRNLSADMIESVEVFDGQSDRAAFSGFDDGNKVKTLNFRTRKEARQGYVGKVSAGYGTDDRYMVGATLNYFNNNRRITVTGLTNNINMSDFSVGETPGGGMRGRRGWGGGSPTGIINTNTLGVNYNDMLGKKIEVSGNYNFVDRENVNNQFRFRDYIGNSEGLKYTDISKTTDSDEIHRFNFRLQYNMNENNRFLVTPSLSIQNSNTLTTREASTTDNSGVLSESVNRNLLDNASINFNNNILYSHRFGTTGRIVTANFNTSYSNTDGETYLTENTDNFADPSRNINRNQFIKTDRENTSWAGNVDYSQKLGEKSRLQLEYNINNRSNDSDKRTYDYAETTGTYSDFNTPLSNTFKSDYITQNAGPSYQYRSDKLRFQANLRYQYATLQGDSEFPKPYAIERSFSNLLPSAEYEYKFSDKQNLNISYRTNTNEPSVEQLQNVLDISNPLQPRVGNPNLNQDFQNRMNVRYRSFNPENNHMFFVGMFGTMTQNYIANAVYTNGAPEEYTGEYRLQPGARLSRPVNMDGYWNVRSFLSYGQPLSIISSNLNLRGFAGYTRIPGMIDDQLNYANTINVGTGFNISSNISEKIDFNISSNANYNFVENTLNTNQNNNYFSLNSSLRYNWILWKGLVYRTELSHQFNSGLSASIDNSYLLWNMSVGKKLFKNQQGEISFSVNDLLKQNVSIQRNVASDYIEDVQSTVLQRYFMVTFSYNIRKFNGGAAPSMDNGKREWGGRSGH
ncbi:outer membrane beta-barrel protein [Pontibacter sp. MBLB2868]|uniref:outer membrane beta-barrel protein n=1 Tax=Pontibacter sp. MBLB2868 TaxID=3451555 RepID=UPI003F74BBA8